LRPFFSATLAKNVAGLSTFQWPKMVSEVVRCNDKEASLVRRFARHLRKGSVQLLYQSTSLALSAVRSSAKIAYHILLVGVSAGIAFSLPSIVNFLSRNFHNYWSLIQNDKIFLISLEAAVAALLIILLSYVRKSLHNRQIAKMAKAAGLVFVSSPSSVLARWKKRKLKEKQGRARDLMIIGSTGYRTFVDPDGDLHNVLKKCREAKIMLLDPFSEGARVRANAIIHPDVSPETFKQQIGKTIALLKALKGVQKNIRLKLYRDKPLMKLTMLGEHMWMQHYHSGLDVMTMPEYMFEHDQSPGSLYTSFYEYLISRWESPEIPEYDLESDELIYRGDGGREVKREKFGNPEAETNLGNKAGSGGSSHRWVR